ncbi:uncharacterized protein FIBRA_02331 [Fibroporia radiculosa]|uniref:FCP1 homology domain-containing protein n=1 Tax=Fibroporia radiculosa TaxID=599839 RepID=J4I901_9APHY|nr:uncharacterized protein FIBRA_02331 [Fibroporia radiculosa]CCM00301.1 predicted protein [Fibroporia radiculosa]
MAGYLYNNNSRHSSRSREDDGRDWYTSEGDPVPSSSQPSSVYADCPETVARPYLEGISRPGSVSDHVRAIDKPDLHSTRLHNLPSRPPPREPRAMRKDQYFREVTPLLKPPVSPTPSYYALSMQSPAHIPDPASSRKLLILDLNGTLVHRAPRALRSQPTESGGPVQRLRPVHPRPYMPAFRAYLFAPETKTWLDVMVWSSAQPHSVADMVDKCFGEHKTELVAVWARDTLGLSANHYSARHFVVLHPLDLACRSFALEWCTHFSTNKLICWLQDSKVQTVKDLNKPWSQLPALLTPLPPSPHPSEASTPRSDRSPSPPTSSAPGASAVAAHRHSASTTLLLDDSPLKAAMQPYNHVCIGEYSGERRTKDLESLQKQRDWEAMEAAREQLQIQAPMSQQQDAPRRSELRRDSPEELPQADADEADLKKRKRKASRRDGSVDAHAEDDTSSATTSVPDIHSPSPDGTKYDGAVPSHKRKRKSKRQKTLEALAQCADVERPEEVYDVTLLAVVGVLEEIKHQYNVAAWIRTGGLWGQQRPDLSPEQNVPSEPRAAGADASDKAISADGEGRKRKKEKRNRRMVNVDGKGGVEMKAGNDQMTNAVLNSRENSPVRETVERASDEVLSGNATAEVPIWFRSLDTMSFWAGKGREALIALGIPVEHGIDH